MRAVRNEPNDRTPIMMCGDIALLRYSKPDATFEWILNNQEEMADIVIGQTLKKLDKIDFLGGGIAVSGKLIGPISFGCIKLPGRDLPPNEMWQPLIPNLMEEEDYDFILKNGWQAFRGMYLFDKLGYDPKEMEADIMLSEQVKAKYREAGYPFLTEIKLPSPFDDLVHARGLVDFFDDVFTMPEKIKDVFEVICTEWEQNDLPKLKKVVDAAKARGEEPLLVIAPCVNANSNMVRRDFFEEFGWPLIERQTKIALELGGVPFFHMDTSWTGFLDYWKEFPAGRCIFDTDGGTDLDKLFEMHGNRFGITGTIPPALMAFGKPDEIYKEYRTQIEKYGNSYILAPSCTLPANAPKENIDAMYAAVEG